MKLSGLRYAVGVGALIVLAGCGGSSSQVGVPVALPQHESASALLVHGHSWMAPEARNEDLLYLSNVHAQSVDVYSYPRGTLVGSLTGFGKPRSECSDAAGDVWIADVGGLDVIEFPHGGTAPIVALNTAGPPMGCAVDPVSGDLAVTGGTNGIVLSVFRHTVRGGWLGPSKFSATNMHGAFCGYDAQGNLFLDEQSGKGAVRFAELSHHGRVLKAVTLSQNVVAPGQVQWDGTNLAVGDAGVSPAVIYQFAMSGGTGTESGSTTLDGTKSVRQFWIQGRTVVAPDPNNGVVDFFSYPAGGSPSATIAARAYGAAVSLAPDH